MVETKKDHLPSEHGKDATSDDKVMRVFLNNQCKGSFICPACKKGVIKDLSEIARSKSAVHIRCKCACGHVYRVLVERRQFFRRKVKMVGMYIQHRGSGQSPLKGIITVQNISQSGVCFSVNSSPHFKIGDLLTVEFTLDDTDRSKVREEGVVQRIEANMVGLEFTSTDRYGKLGQYLLR